MNSYPQQYAGNGGNSSVYMADQNRRIQNQRAVDMRNMQSQGYRDQANQYGGNSTAYMADQNRQMEQAPADMGYRQSQMPRGNQYGGNSTAYMADQNRRIENQAAADMRYMQSQGGQGNQYSGGGTAYMADQNRQMQDQAAADMQRMRNMQSQGGRGNQYSSGGTAYMADQNRRIEPQPDINRQVDPQFLQRREQMRTADFRDANRDGVDDRDLDPRSVQDTAYRDMRNIAAYDNSFRVPDNNARNQITRRMEQEKQFRIDQENQRRMAYYNDAMRNGSPQMQKPNLIDQTRDRDVLQQIERDRARMALAERNQRTNENIKRIDPRRPQELVNNVERERRPQELVNNVERERRPQELVNNVERQPSAPQPEGQMRTRDFRDSNRDGVDDRDEGKAPTPQKRPPSEVKSRGEEIGNEIKRKPPVGLSKDKSSRSDERSSEPRRYKMSKEELEKRRQNRRAEQENRRSERENRRDAKTRSQKRVQQRVQKRKDRSQSRGLNRDQRRQRRRERFQQRRQNRNQNNSRRPNVNRPQRNTQPVETSSTASSGSSNVN